MARGKEPIMKKINPPEGKKKDVPVRSAHRAQAPKYRMLRANEIIRKGDQFENSEGKWRPALSVGEHWYFTVHAPYRRKVTPKSPTPKPSRRAR